MAFFNRLCALPLGSVFQAATLLISLQPQTQAATVTWYNNCNVTASSSDVVSNWARVDQVNVFPRMTIIGVSSDLRDSWWVTGDVWYVKWWDNNEGSAPPTLVSAKGNDTRPIAGFTVPCNVEDPVGFTSNNCHWALLGTVTDETGTPMRNDYQWTSCGGHT